MSILGARYFHDEKAAFARLEAILWPDGPICPHCGGMDRVYKIKANPKKKVRLGLMKCGHCRKQFTVKVGTVFESSHVALNLWFQAVYLMCASKKGISAHQLHRTLGVTYKTAWFMAHRVREAMRDPMNGGLGGVNRVVEADETYVGGKSKNRKHRVPPKEPVVSLVERDGRVRSFHVKNVTAKTIRPILVTQIDRKSYLMTDESRVYKTAGREFSGHGSVNHSAEEYVRGNFWHTNTI